MAFSFTSTRPPMRTNAALSGRGVSVPPVSAPRSTLEPLVRSLGPPRGARLKDEEGGCASASSSSVAKPFAGTSSDELPAPEALQQSVATGARFVIQHLPPLEGSLPTLTAKPAPMDYSDELPDLSAAAMSLETCHDASAKPHISFSCLIAMAILDSPAQKLTVSEIYDWMKNRYPYFATPAAGMGWKNSVRHNLSLNRHFVKKVREEEDVGGKGSFWTVRAESVPLLEAAVVKQAKIYQRFGGGLGQIAGLVRELSLIHI